ncbi:MAG: DUF3489 domain-containing protein [Rhizobiales bacterium]|nr:DUF3489 domain-containing protein [Hyphomicrobiales bacterium]
MTKPSDAQLIVFSAACQRPDRNVLPLPERMKGGAAQKIVASLLGKQLIEEVVAGANEPVWRDGEDGGRTTLRATDAALQALGIDPEEGARAQGSEGDGGASEPADPVEEDQADQQTDTPAPPATGGDRADAGTGEPTAAETASASPAAGQVRKTRPDTKQAKLVAMLQSPHGASLDEIVAATGWQDHTVRGAIAGALKKKLGLTITSEKVEGRGRVYRIGVAQVRQL